MELFRSDNVRLERRDGGAAVLWLDLAGKAVNLLTGPFMADLGAALDRLAEDASVRTVYLVSAKSQGFVAGADINEFAALRTPDEAAAVSERGQRLFDRLAALPAVTVALVHGACLGGGLEVALACDYRVAVDHPKTTMGLPEIELGLLPGWGGTQRLPRVVGLERALRIILGGKRLGAREALKWGLVDAVVPARDDPAAYLTDLQRQPFGGKRPRTKLPLRTWRQKLVESTAVGRSLILRGAERVLKRRLPDDMPAPYEALAAVKIGLKSGAEAGLAHERAAAGRLALTPACRNLVTLFLRREQARKVPAQYREGGPEIRRVGVVGGGTMGAGIAQLAAFKGCAVVLQEVNDEALGAGLLKIATLFEQAVRRGLLSAAEARQRVAGVRGTLTWEGFDGVDLVVEAVLEDMKLKRSLFAELEGRTGPDTILATNTSSLTVRELQAGLRHPGRVAGLHFFNPVHKMPLVEVARAPATGEAAVAALVRWAVQLGKTPVVVRDSPGFVVNRILMPYLNEAVTLLNEGMTVEQVDAVMRRFGMPMGPLELLDQIGLDVAAHVVVTMGPVFRGALEANPLFARMCDRGFLGQKSGAGFYLHRVRNRRPNPVLGDLLPEPQPRAARGPTEARDRLVLPMVNEAAACYGQDLAESAEALDLAMVLGTGWAPHRGGPLRYAEDCGLAALLQTLEGLQSRHGPRFEPCPALREKAAGGGSFFPTAQPPAPVTA